jgi:hypothetical protein
MYYADSCFRADIFLWRDRFYSNLVMMSKLVLLKKDIPDSKIRSCVACGNTGIDGRRRYCSSDCRRQMMWVLSLSNGLLSIFNTRYASFSFSRLQVVLDILPAWSKEISRFTHKRTPGRKPADDLKTLILDSGNEYYTIIADKKSRSFASQSLLKKNSNSRIPVKSIKPGSKTSPRLSKAEKESLKRLKLKLEEVLSGEKTARIKSAYKKMARIHHPDMGGDAAEFRKLKDAHETMLMWAENPHYTSKKALEGCWSFDSSSGRWIPPL